MKIFGTDGVRAKIDSDIIGAELPHLMRAIYKNINPESVVIGRDTRKSGNRILNLISNGLVGAKLLNFGIVPTPAVSVLTEAHKADLGISITASHNQSQYNGIKLFNKYGYKLDEDVLRSVEQHFETIKNTKFVNNAKTQFQLKDPNIYINTLINYAGGAGVFDGFKIIVDCANGATFSIAQQVFTVLGCDSIFINCAPNGENINKDCGSLFPKQLVETAKANKIDLGVAFDGDGDRAIFVDENGIIRDGDYFLYVVAKNWQQKKKLQDNVVVSTILANMGLDRVFKNLNIKLIRTGVGDKFISNLMKEHNYSLGGEQSGHFILKDFKTGDGILSTIEILKILKSSKKRLSQLCAGFSKVPQISYNMPIKNKPPLENIPEIQENISTASRILGDGGRILIRYSGTENYLRIMIEGDSQSKINYLMDAFVSNTQHVFE